MKLQDFRYPHAWCDRKVAIHDRVLFIPSYWDQYESYSFPGWNDKEIFENQGPIHVEYCSGNGEWICEKAKAFPDICWVAVDKRFDRVRKIWLRMKKWGLKNLFIVFGEAELATRLYFPNHSIHECYINFPDPWPKTKHAKHRLISSEFVSEIKRTLLPEGQITLATDDPETSTRMIHHFSSDFRSVYENPYYIHDLAGYGDSFFESMWRQKGKKIHYHRFVHYES
jgi:tRNA (guanine-N7-)-methyltransferase